MIQKYVYALREVCQSYYPALEAYFWGTGTIRFYEDDKLKEKPCSLFGICCKTCGEDYFAWGVFECLTDRIARRDTTKPRETNCEQCKSGELFQELISFSAEGSKELFQLSLLVDQSV